MQIEFSSEAKKDLKKIPRQEANKIARKILFLGKSPLEGKRLFGKLEEQYSLRAWPYRIIYQIYQRDEVVLILKIEHRQGVYK